MTQVADIKAGNLRGGSLDALRFLAALFVVVFHFGDSAPVALQSVHSIFGRGYLATDFFLMLSGFVLARAYGRQVAGRQVSTSRFWFKRLARSYPTHLMTLGLLMVMVAVGHLIGLDPAEPGRFDWSGVPAQVLLLPAFGIGGGHWNTPSWTLSALLVCYLFFPALWRRVARLRRAPEVLALGLIVLFGSDLVSLAVLGGESFNLDYQWSLFRAAPLFVTGLLIARLVETARPSAAAGMWTGWAGAGALALNVLIGGPDLFSVLATAAVIVGCGARPPRRVIPGAQTGARVSFSLFMTHTLAGAVWFDLIQPMAAPFVGAWLLWFGALGFAVLGAVAYDRLVDAPIQARLQPWLARRFTARPAPHPATAPNGSGRRPTPHPRPSRRSPARSGA